MSEQPKRTPQEVREAGVKQLIRSYEEINRTACPQKKIREFVDKYNYELLPKIFDIK